MRDPGLRKQFKLEMQVGLLVVLSFLALVVGVVWISRADIGAHRLELVGIGPDAAGLTSGSRISSAGVEIGSVEQVRIEGDHVAILFAVDRVRPFGRETRAIIRPSDFLGNRILELIAGGGEPLVDGDTISVGTMPDMQALANKLGDRATHILDQTRALLSDETINKVRHGSVALAETMTELRALVGDERRTLTRLIDNLAQTSDHLTAATEGGEIERTSAHLDSLMERLSHAGAALDSTSHSLASILGKVDRGEGSLGLLVNDSTLYGGISAAAENLRAASEEIALLTRDVRERPDRYLKDVKISVF